MKKLFLFLLLIGITLAVAMQLNREQLNSSDNSKISTLKPSVLRYTNTAHSNKQVITKSKKNGRTSPLQKVSRSIERCLAEKSYESNLSDPPVDIWRHLHSSISNITSEKKLWSNIHFIGDDGRIYRLRHMVDDGENGEYQKLSLYVEDEDQFAHPHPLPAGINKINPAPGEIAAILKNKEIIHQEEASSFQGEDQELFVEEINGEITRVEFAQGRVFVKCRERVI